VNYFSLLKRVFDENGGPEKAKDRVVPDNRKWQSLYLEILFGLSCFQLAYPELFDLFVQNPTPQRLHQLSEWKQLDGLSVMDKIAERVDDIEDVKTDITGFFDQLVTILDADDDWEISVQEFQPIWDVVRYANLAGDTISRTDNTWEQIDEMVEEFAQEAEVSDERLKEFKKSIKLLERSAWNNPLHLQAKNGGLHFFNLFWDRCPLGSITSAQTDPLQFYIVTESYDAFTDNLSEEAQKYVENAGEKHYGEGTIRIHLRDLLDAKDPRSHLKEHHQAALKTR